MEKLRVRPMAISKAQQRFRSSKAWLTGFVGGRNSGKTRIGCIHIAMTAKPGDPWMAVSPDNNMVRETTLPTFLEVTKFTGQYIDHVVSPTPRVWFRTLWGGKAELVFKGAEKPNKLLGGNKAGIWYDEGSITSQAAFDLGIGVCRWRGKMGPCLVTFTPRGFRHWTFERFFDLIDESKIGNDGCSADGIEWFQGRAYRRRPDTNLIHCATRDNPFAPKEYVGRIGANYSSTLALQELEGEYIEIKGLIFRREWLRFEETSPAIASRVRYWDKASTAEDGCYTVGVLMARDPIGVYYVEDVVRGQWSQFQRNQVMLETARRDAIKYGGSVLTYIEQEGGGDGKSIAEQLIIMLSEFPVYRDVVSAGGKWKTKGQMRLPGDAKVRRALPFAAQCEAGNVRIVPGAWNSTDYLEELCAFPEFAYSDQVDASSGAFRMLQQSVPDGIYSERSVTAASPSRYGIVADLDQNRLSRWEDLPWNQVSASASSWEGR